MVPCAVNISVHQQDIKCNIDSSLQGGVSSKLSLTAFVTTALLEASDNTKVCYPSIIVVFNVTNGSIFGKMYLLAIDHIMLALFWSYVPNMK